MNKPTRDELKNMKLKDYLEWAEHFCNACAACGQIGNRVEQSIEGKGFYYCVDAKSCGGVDAD